MKRLHLYLALALLSLPVTTLQLFAQNDRDPQSAEKLAAFREKLLKEFDKDGDGRLSDEERKAAMKSRGQVTKSTGRLPELLKRFDKDGDGELSPDEQAAAKKFRDQFGKRDEVKDSDATITPEKIIGRFDKDGDGKLNLEELAAFLQARADMATNAFTGSPKLEELKKRFDKDGDGKLSDAERSELQKAFGAGSRSKSNDEAANRKSAQEELLKKFDRDGDGKLSVEEKAAARAALESRGKKP